MSKFNFYHVEKGEGEAFIRTNQNQTLMVVKLYNDTIKIEKLHRSYTQTSGEVATSITAQRFWEEYEKASKELITNS